MKNGPVVADRAVLPEQPRSLLQHHLDAARLGVVAGAGHRLGLLQLDLVRRATPAALSAALTASARCLASSAFVAGSPVASV